MPVFRTTIRGHLDLTRKLPELPDIIEQVSVDECDSPEELTQRIVARLRKIVDDRGMGARMKKEFGPDLKIFVFEHMIVYVDVDINGTTYDMPLEDPDNIGQWIDRSGKPVKKQ